MEPMEPVRWVLALIACLGFVAMFAMIIAGAYLDVKGKEKK